MLIVPVFPTNTVAKNQGDSLLGSSLHEGIRPRPRSQFQLVFQITTKAADQAVSIRLPLGDTHPGDIIPVQEVRIVHTTKNARNGTFLHPLKIKVNSLLGTAVEQKKDRAPRVRFGMECKCLAHLALLLDAVDEIRHK